MTTFRVGQGFDIHRLVTGRPFVLGGVVIPADKGPEGHSDGDALIHGIVDALLGAAGLGDIGDWFSPDDPQYHQADSRCFLKQTQEKLTQQGWQIENIDTTILLEAPKLLGQKKAIQMALADQLTLAPEHISIKAKTMEKLGAVGRQEAIAVFTVALISKHESGSR